MDSGYTSNWARAASIDYAALSSGTRLRYLKTGTGPPLLLMHTLRTQLDYFQRLIPRLADHFTVYAVDLPGLGGSEIRRGARYDEPTVRRDIVELIQHLELQDFTLAGESMGDQWFSLEDRKGVVFILNLTDVAAASAMLEQLPLGRAHLMQFQLIPIGPLNPLRQLPGMTTGAP